MKQRTQKRSAQEAAYNRRVKVWKKEHPHCKACEQLLIFRPGPPVIRRTSDCHHIRGRNGALLLDERFWLPVCRQCHRFITEYGSVARKLGFTEDVNYRERMGLK